MLHNSCSLQSKSLRSSCEDGSTTTIEGVVELVERKEVVYSSSLALGTCLAALEALEMKKRQS